MGRGITMYVLFVAVVSGIVGIGTFRMRSPNDKTPMVLQHPDGCVLTDPSPLYDGEAAGATAVYVTPGYHKFTFNCDGKDVVLEKIVKPTDIKWDVRQYLQNGR